MQVVVRNADIAQGGRQAGKARQGLQPLGETFPGPPPIDQALAVFCETKQLAVALAHALGIPANDVRQHDGNGETMCGAVALRQRVRAGVRRPQHRVLDGDACEVRTEKHGAAARHVVGRSEHAFVVGLDQAPGFAGKRSDAGVRPEVTNDSTAWDSAS